MQSPVFLPRSELLCHTDSLGQGRLLLVDMMVALGVLSQLWAPASFNAAGGAGSCFCCKVGWRFSMMLSRRLFRVAVLMWERVAHSGDQLHSAPAPAGIARNINSAAGTFPCLFLQSITPMYFLVGRGMDAPLLPLALARRLTQHSELLYA